MNQFEKDSLGNRMKHYESVSYSNLVPRMPVVIRVDGRAFHTYTKNMYPFDLQLRDAMVQSAMAVAVDMQGFEAAYHQSDEVSFLLTDYATIETERWFDYSIQKVSSVTASLMTAHFNKLITEIFTANHREAPKSLAFFDARAFNVPKEDVANMFLWRCKDWERNSLQMYCRTFFSSKQLHKKKRADMHEMLHQIGKNWTTDISSFFRNGSFIFRNKIESEIQPNYNSVSSLIDPLVFKNETIGDYFIERDTINDVGTV